MLPVCNSCSEERIRPLVFVDRGTPRTLVSQLSLWAIEGAGDFLGFRTMGYPGTRRLAVLSMAMLVATSAAAYAQEGDDLREAAQNPVADLISVPLQNNTNFNVGTLDNTQNVLNIQPVIPFTLNENWNLITRTIMPVIYQPALVTVPISDWGT